MLTCTDSPIFADAPWCGHCKALAPEYAKAATQLADEKSEVVLAKIDATEQGELAEKYEIRGYPTIKFFRNGKAVEYSGGRSSDDIVRWVKKKSGPAAKTLTTADEAKEFKSSSKVVVVGLFSDLEGASAKAFLEAAALNDEIPFAISSDKAVWTELGSDKEGVILFKDFDEGRNELEGEVTADSVKTFVAANSLPLVVEFSHEVSPNTPVSCDNSLIYFIMIYRLHKRFSEERLKRTTSYSSARRVMMPSN